MKFCDLLVMSLNNLRRRKLRTALTVLGVIIGTASIIVMVSLGIGLQELNMESLSSWTSLTEITVRQNYSGDPSVSNEDSFITDDVVERLSKLDHVVSVSPVLRTSVIIRQGIYICEYASIEGISRDALEKITLEEGGRLPDPNAQQMEMVFGNMVVQDFMNSKTKKYYYETGELADLDMSQPFFVIFDQNAYYQSLYPSGDSDVKPPKKYMLNTVGVVAGGTNNYNSYSYSIYTDVEQLKTQLRKVFKKNPIPGQPTNSKGKPYSYFVYDSAEVQVDDMENVKEVQQIINDMGFQASSMIEGIENQQRQAGMIQAVLGGIGAVSLFVAAIGIANTMMMSIYERTKEIGVMKVLGCDMGSIRNMFLIESGFIGLAGGVIGIGLSYGISYLVNHIGGISQAVSGMEGDISRIPFWLVGLAIVFAVVVGMGAGFMPAMRAMRLSPLAAIRNE